jgi:hypothetical protein
MATGKNPFVSAGKGHGVSKEEGSMFDKEYAAASKDGRLIEAEDRATGG